MIDFNPNTKIKQEKVHNGDYPEPVYAGKAYPQYDRKLNKDRLVISLKLFQESKGINLAKSIQDTNLSFNVIRKKEVDKFGNTHFIVVNQLPVGLWPKQKKVNNNQIAEAKVDEYGNISFTLSQEDLFNYSYAYGEPSVRGTYMKLEFIDNGPEQYIFRYFKEYKSPQLKFINAPKVATAAAPQETANQTSPQPPAPDSDDAFFADLNT